MKADAEAHADEDKRMKEEADKINAADAMIFQTENFLKENGDKVPADKKSEVESALKELKDAHASKNIAGIDSATERLNNVLQSVSQNMYQGANPNQGQAQGNPQQENTSSNNGNNNTNNNDNVTDADFEEV